MLRGVRGESIGATANITIEVDETAARAFAEAAPGERQKLQLLLSLRLQELTSAPDKSLQTVMDEIGRAAEARGLTPEVLETLLRDILGYGSGLWDSVARQGECLYDFDGGTNC